MSNPEMTDLGELYEQMVITDARRFRQAVASIMESRHRYEQVAAMTGVPWRVVACLHIRESDGDFGCHLHNGDPLSGRTIHVPAGHPLTGNPPFAWEESAEDALRLEGYCGLNRWEDMNVLLDRIERFNGLGYRHRGEHSPYLWAGTSLYRSGKFVADGHYDPNAIDRQPGCAGLLKLIS